MAKKRTHEQNKEIYQRRKQRAINEGFTGYGQKRYRKEKAKRNFKGGQLDIEDLQRRYPGIIPIGEIPLSEDRQRAYDRLENSGRYTQAELDALRDAPRDEYWPLYRTLYQKLVV